MRSILITGCSSGIGRACALHLHQQGWQVFAAVRKPEALAPLQTSGMQAVLIDVQNSESIRAGIHQVLDITHGKLDAIFNNAGILQVGAVEDLSRDAIRSQFETNVFGPMELIAQVLPVMRKQGHGRIIQNSSILGTITLPYYGAYNASKFALNGFSHTLRQELKNTGIHVSIIAPGPVESDLRDHAFELFQKNKPQTQQHSAVYENIEKNYFKKKHSQLTVSSAILIKQLMHALNSTSPKTLYYTGLPAKIAAKLHGILPTRVFDFLIETIK